MDVRRVTSAVYRAMIAAALARECLALDGVDVILIPVFVVVRIAGRSKMALRFSVEPR